VTARRPSNPWKVVYSTPGGPYDETHRSRPAAYRAVDAEKQRVADGISRVVRMSIYQWDVGGGSWQLYENAWDKNA